MAGYNQFTNNAATTLASGISAIATSLTVASSTGALFPTLAGSNYFYCTLANNAGTVEIVKVTARSTDTFTIVRGQDNTTAAAWVTGDKVELRVTAADLNNFPQLDSTNTFALAQTMTIPLAAGSGGTGLSSPGSSGNALVSNGTAWTSASVNAFPAGTRLAFQQSTAPTGWTQDTTTANLNDSVMRIVTGTPSSGGSQAFSTWNALTATGATTLTSAQIPGHTHNYSTGTLVSGTCCAGKFPASFYTGSTTGTTDSGTGGGGSHTHSLTNGIKYFDFLIASKN